MKKFKELVKPEIYYGILILTFTTLIIYYPINEAGSIIDDHAFFINDRLTSNPTGLWRIWFEPFENNGIWPYIPITRSTFWMERQIWGLNLMLTHWINVILHLMTAILFWRFLKYLKFRSAWLVAMCFVLHPIHVQSVAWIAERKNVVSGIFFVLTLWGYVLYEQRKCSKWYWATIGFYLCALLSKTSTIMLPVLFIIYRLWRQASWKRSDAQALIPFFILAGVSGVFRIWYELQFFGAGGEAYVRSFLERLLTAAHIPFFYLSKIIFPYPLMFQYPKWEIEITKPSLYLPVFSIVVVFGILILKYHSWSRPVLWGLAAFGVLLFPVLGFFNNAWTQFSYVADHWVYLPSLVLLLLLLENALNGIDWAWEKMGNLPFQGRAKKVFPIIVFSIMAGLTWQQTLVYFDLETLSKDSIAKNPKAWVFYFNLGLVLEKQGKTQEALSHFDRAIEFSPLFTDAYEHRGLAYLKLQQFELANADFTNAIQLDPNSSSFYGNRGLTFFRLNQTENALKDLTKALQLNPHSEEFYNNRGGIYLELNQYSQAIDDLSKALELNPEAISAFLNRGLAYRQLQNLQLACMDWRQACKLGQCEFYESAKKLGDCLQ